MKRLTPGLAGHLLALLIFGLVPAAHLAAADMTPATVRLTVPADAVVEFDGTTTRQMGGERYFITPFLDVGKRFSYHVKVTFTRNGKPATIERDVTVVPGKETALDLTREEPKTEEPKVVVKKVEPKVVVKKVEPKKEVAKAEPKKEVVLDVPYVPTPEPVVEAMLKLANVTAKDVVYDLGCGDGRIVITAVKKFKAKSGMGVELFPDRVKLSKENAKKAGVDKQVEIREGSVLDLKSVSGASVVTLYLLPQINLQLMPMLKKSLKPGARIVSHDFDMGDWKADKEISVQDDRGRTHTIYLWTIAGAKQAEPKKVEPKKAEPKKEVRLDVPYVPTPQPVVDAMLKLAKVTAKDVVYDLGCGDGRIVITAVKKFKAKSGLGVELFPERVVLSKENAKKAGVDKQVEIREGSVLDLKSVSDASVVTLYLLPQINLKLMPMLKKTLKPGSRIVSHDFDMGDWKEDKKIELTDGDGMGHTIYLWTIPAKK